MFFQLLFCHPVSALWGPSLILKIFFHNPFMDHPSYFFLVSKPSLLPFIWKSMCAKYVGVREHWPEHEWQAGLKVEDAPQQISHHCSSSGGLGTGGGSRASFTAWRRVACLHWGIWGVIDSLGHIPQSSFLHGPLPILQPNVPGYGRLLVTILEEEETTRRRRNGEGEGSIAFEKDCHGDCWGQGLEAGHAPRCKGKLHNHLKRCTFIITVFLHLAGVWIQWTYRALQTSWFYDQIPSSIGHEKWAYGQSCPLWPCVACPFTP